MLGWFRKKKKPAEEVPESVESESVQDEPAGESAKSVESESIQDEPAAESVEPAESAPVLDELVDELADKPAIDSAEPVQSPAPEPEKTGEDRSARKGMWQRLHERLAKTRDSLVARMDSLFLGKKVIDPELFDDLEEILITADLGVGTTQDLLDKVRQEVRRDELTDPLVLKERLKTRILSYLRKFENPPELAMPDSEPFVVMVIGVNGVGKTTTIGKLAYKFVQSGHRVLLVAADTFRAAAISQLKIWGERIGVEVLARESGADPSSVVYDAMDYAGSRDFDVIIVDTAGRLHTKVNLMEELKKIKRVIAKKAAAAPHEILLVLDATTGQNSISQTRTFHEAVGVTGLALTKLDGTAKGGIVVNICHEFDIPIRFIGIGEQMEDLRDFDPGDFVEALFGGSAEDTESDLEGRMAD